MWQWSQPESYLSSLKKKTMYTLSSQVHFKASLSVNDGQFAGKGLDWNIVFLSGWHGGFSNVKQIYLGPAPPTFLKYIILKLFVYFMGLVWL